MKCRQIFSDDDLLDWVNLRAAGVPPTEIAKRYGTKDQYIRAATARVRNADAKHHDDKIEFSSHQHKRKAKK